MRMVKYIFNGSNVPFISNKSFVFYLIPTWPCIFIITTVFDRLHTTNCSRFLGNKCTELTAISVVTLPTEGLNVCWHSVDFMFQIWNDNHTPQSSPPTLSESSSSILLTSLTKTSFIYLTFIIIIFIDFINISNLMSYYLTDH